MKTKSILSFPLLALALMINLSLVRAGEAGADKWADWQFLLGDWVGADSAGAPGKASAGGCSFAVELQGAVIVRKNHAEYPATKDRPAAVHDDLMTIYRQGNLVRADYFDSEGHVIHYTATRRAADKSWVFLGDVVAGQPRFRLTYTETSPTELKLAFEMTAPGKPDAFQPYISATLQRPSKSAKSTSKSNG
jgi:hypothetical protein